MRNFVHLFGRKPAFVWYDNKLGDTLSMFRLEKSHMAVVIDVVSEGAEDPVYKVVGIITLEDIIEEILGAEIEDETENPDSHKMLTSRDANLARLKTTHKGSIIDQELSNDETNSISIYLFTNVPEIQHLFQDNMQNLEKIIRSSTVISLVRSSPDPSKPNHEDYLYIAGKMNNTCTLILSGEMTIQSSKEGSGFSGGATKGPWSILGVDALIQEEGTYIPDFSAYISSDRIRFLSMSCFKDVLSTADSIILPNKSMSSSSRFKLRNRSNPASQKGILSTRLFRLRCI